MKTVERESHGSTYLFVELYDTKTDKRRKIGVSTIVWMAGTKHSVPTDFIVHHQDTNTFNNAFDNLYCLHDLDHKKLHGMDLLHVDDDEVPF